MVSLALKIIVMSLMCGLHPLTVATAFSPFGDYFDAGLNKI